MRLNLRRQSLMALRIATMIPASRSASETCGSPEGAAAQRVKVLPPDCSNHPSRQGEKDRGKNSTVIAHARHPRGFLNEDPSGSESSEKAGAAAFSTASDIGFAALASLSQLRRTGLLRGTEVGLPRKAARA